MATTILLILVARNFARFGFDVGTKDELGRTCSRDEMIYR